MRLRGLGEGSSTRNGGSFSGCRPGNWGEEFIRERTVGEDGAEFAGEEEAELEGVVRLSMCTKEEERGRRKRP